MRYRARDAFATVHFTLNPSLNQAAQRGFATTQQVQNMTTAFLKSTAAAALVMLSLGAQADAVTLNFDGLLANESGPVAATNSEGFSFTGAYVWESRFSATGPTSSDPIPDDSNSGNGFIANRSQTTDGLTIGMNLLAVPNVTRYIRSITFDMFVPADTPFAYGYAGGSTTAAATIAAPTFSVGTGKAWIPGQLLDFGADSRVSRLEFGGSGQGTIGLDNLIIQFTASDIGGGTVPEPASYALVALALLAAGGASRRRKA